MRRIVLFVLLFSACLPLEPDGPDTTTVEPSCDVEGFDAEVEPNEDERTATRIGATAVGSISGEGDVDVYEVVSCGERILQVDLGNSPVFSTVVDLYFEVFDADGTQLDSVVDYDGEDGITTLTTNVYLPEAGSYYVEVRDWGDNDADLADYTLTTTLLVVPDGDAEPNGNEDNAGILRSMATPIVSGVPTTAYLASSGDQDVFAITVDGESMIDLEVSNVGVVSTPTDLHVTVLGLDAETAIGEEVDYDGEDGTTHLSTARYLPEAGTYYVLIQDWGTNDYDYAQPYVLDVTVMSDPDETVEPNGNESNADALGLIATPLIDGEWFDGHLATEGDEDVYAIVAGQEMLLEVEIETIAAATPIDIHATILDVDAETELGGEVDYDGEDGSTILREVRYLPTAGTYYVSVHDWGDDDYDFEQPYRIRLTTRPVPDGPNEPNGNTDNEDLLASIATPLTLGAETSGFIASEEDEDCYAVAMNSAGPLRVRLTNAPTINTGVDYHVEIYESGNASSLGREVDYDGADGTTTLTGMWNVPSGDYVVCVDDWGDDDYDDDGYRLVVDAL